MHLVLEKDLVVIHQNNIKINNKQIIEYTLDNFINNNKINSIYIVYNKKHESHILPLKKEYKILAL